MYGGKGDKSLCHDRDIPVKGRRDGVVTGNEGAKGGPNAHQSGNATEDGYTKRGSFPIHGGALTKREISGGEG